MVRSQVIHVDSEGRLDKRLAEKVEESRSRVQDWIRAGKVRLDGRKITSKSTRIQPDTQIQVERPEGPQSREIVAEDEELTVLHEDDDLLAVHKPGGVVVHPTDSQRSGTLVNRLLYHYPELRSVGPRNRAGLAHRLDKGTSGVLLVARNEATLNDIKGQFRQRTVKKKYRAVVEGRIDDRSIKIDVPIGRDPNNPTLRRADPEGKRAVTGLEVQSVGREQTNVYYFPETGRTHQLRVHSKYLGHPIVGDSKYNTSGSCRLMLHAESIQFEHPTAGETMSIESAPGREVIERWNSIQKTS